MPFLQDLIDIGVDCFNTVQTDAANMDAIELKKRFGKNLTFWGGGVDTHGVLPIGTPEEVRDTCAGGLPFWPRRRLRVLLHPQHLRRSNLQYILAAFDAAYDFGTYPIQAGTESPEELGSRLTAINYWVNHCKLWNRVASCRWQVAVSRSGISQRIGTTKVAGSPMKSRDRVLTALKRTGVPDRVPVQFDLCRQLTDSFGEKYNIPVDYTTSYYEDVTYRISANDLRTRLGSDCVVVG